MHCTAAYTGVLLPHFERIAYLHGHILESCGICTGLVLHSPEFSVGFVPALHFDTQLEECRGERTSVCWIAILCRMNTTAENASLIENGNICSSDARYIVVVDAMSCQAVILSQRIVTRQFGLAITNLHVLTP